MAEKASHKSGSLVDIGMFTIVVDSTAAYHKLIDLRVQVTASS